MSPRPHLSVIVASYNAPATLEHCLESLAAQLEAGDEVIVADCSTGDPRERLGRDFPHVRFLRFERRLSIPALRREAIKSARGEILALTESRLVPSKEWAAVLREAHNTHPKAPAVGGPVDHTPSSAFDSAVFFCEYGLHMPPTGDGETGELTGANLSYKRWAVELFRDLLDAAAWEPFLHQRLKERGHRLLRAGRAVVFYRNSLAAGQFFRQRFHYGRWFAASRVEGAGFLRKFLYAGFCPLLPLVLAGRLGRVALERGGGVSFLKALPWIALFQIVWSIGEFCGYLGGKGTSDRQVF